MYVSNINSATIEFQSIVREELIKEQSLKLYHPDHLTLLYLTKGKSTLELEGCPQTKTELKSGELLLLNPNHALNLTANHQNEIIQLSLHGILFTASKNIHSTDEFFVMSDDQFILQKYFQLLKREHQTQTNGVDLITKRLVDCILIHILSNCPLSIRDYEALAHPEDYQEIRQLQLYIHKYYHLPLTLDYLASQAQMNKYYLIRMFKQQTGLSPIDYLIHIRLDEAQRLLTQTELSIAVIAEQVGFCSPSHFSKTFKQNHGLTPSQYRQQYSLCESTKT